LNRPKGTIVMSEHKGYERIEETSRPKEWLLVMPALVKKKGGASFYYSRVSNDRANVRELRKGKGRGENPFYGLHIR